MTHQQMADEFEISINSIRVYCYKMGYRKYKDNPAPESVPSKQATTRYGNVSQDEIINKYLNMNI